jgi:hypothetical protein
MDTDFFVFIRDNPWFYKKKDYAETPQVPDKNRGHHRPCLG